MPGHTWTKPNTSGVTAPKLAYVARFAPFNWVIGTGEYLDDTEKEIKREVLDRVDHMRDGDNEVLFRVSVRRHIPLATSTRHISARA